MSAVSVCVAGSLMFDVVMRTPRRPQRGETVVAEACGTFLGGKGFNQAIAARRMGATVAMIGRLGDDELAPRFRRALAAEGIDGSGITLDGEAGTGIATPLIEADGSNSIVVAPRANMRVTPADIERSAHLVRAAHVLLLQLEIPADASAAAARIACAAGRPVILNPAPALPFPEELLRLAAVLTPNEVEAAALAGFAVDGIEGAFTAADALRGRGVGTVVVTLGGLGAVAVGEALRMHLPAHHVAVEDTTAAGDAFNGALAVALAETGDLVRALHWANAAGACAVQRLGAEPSMARREQIAALLRPAP